MTTKAEGIWGCTVLGAKAGELDGVPNVQITVQITDGPDKGQRVNYEEIVNTQTAKYVRWSCEPIGWKGASLRTLEDDVAAWITKTGGASTVEIKHIAVKKGKAFKKWEDGGCVGPSPIWDKVAGIGRGAPRPLAPLGASLRDADEAMRSVGGPPPDDDVPHAASGGGYDPYDDLPEARS
jgi:hypothetical protein